ncbi:MAG: sigma-54-dependent Fis family transcriptional regulator [Acidobacteriota bacterium]|nr:sigma-54-dependent Fis family transcriptional regulator [Acidobacteriota bacterium]
MIRIGLISEDPQLHMLLSSGMGKDFRVFRESNVPGIEKKLASDNYEVLLLDFATLADVTANHLERIETILAFRLPVIVMADEELQDKADEVVEMGALRSCRRPPSIRDLKEMVTNAQAVSSAAPKTESAAQRSEVESDSSCDRMLGGSSRMRAVYKQVRQVSNINAAVLIQGESGSGKELIARAIHNTGSRSGKPFIAVSCSAIPETLIEAELFGHEKGAFTGTVGSREGFFEQAQDGTLFLDEIGDLSPFTQVKLLRVLQEMEFNRLGSTRIIPLRARLIFATHQNLPKLIAEGKFRQDLYYRINVIRIEAPSLAEHPEDIPQIATHFLRQYSTLFDKPMDSIEPEAMAVLQSYSWPGNVRELENLVQRAIAMAPGRILRAEDLPITLPSDKVIEFNEINPEGSFEEQLREYKIKIATDAVRQHNGNKTLAARSLGISRAYLHRLIRPTDSETSFDQDDIGTSSMS